jgi:hypothetical protein
MDTLIGKITAELAEKEGGFPPGLADRINRNIKPPEPVVADNIYIRAMYIVSDQINSYGGRFPVDEHERLMELLIDSPVLIGHRKDSLPIARNFHAEQVRRGDVNWVKVYFYWLKNSDGGEDLKNNIDAGIYKECSISFIFGFPECNICGGDIRECRHRPFHDYQSEAGEKKAAYFNYRQIERVLETSLVYRGSINDTALTKDMAFSKVESAAPEKSERPGISGLRRTSDLKSFDRSQSYLVLPAYEGISLLLEKADDNFRWFRYDGVSTESERLDRLIEKVVFPPGDMTLDCRLIGFRGKERQKASELIRYLKGEKSSVTRLELRIYDLVYSEECEPRNLDAGARRAKIESLFSGNCGVIPPAEPVKGADLATAIKKLRTRYGAEIYATDFNNRFLFTRRKLHSATVAAKDRSAGGFKYTLAFRPGDNDIIISDSFLSPFDLEVGDTIELEASSAFCSGDTLEFLDGEIVDSHGAFGRADISADFFQSEASIKPFGRYSILASTKDIACLAIFPNKGEPGRMYAINNFMREELEKGRWFIAAPGAVPTEISPSPPAGGVIIDQRKAGESLIYTFDGFLNGRYVMRPGQINGRSMTVFYKLIDKETTYELGK